MPPQALYRKWRPQLWDEVVGQDHVVQTLRYAIQADRMAHAYLFSGPRGCGKTTSARLVAKALNCLNPDPARRPCNACAHCLAVNEGRFLDLIEIDGASNNSVENIRDLRDKINFAPTQGRFKIYIIDEVHMLSMGAFNALLKTLEEPPPHAVFILATTEIYKIPATVASRCQRFEFRRIPVADIVARLKTLCDQERLHVEPAALELVARQATGALRDAISLLDQLVSADESVTLAQAQALLGAAVGQTIQELSAALAAGDASAGLNRVAAAVDAGTDPRQLARQIVDYLRALLLVKLGNAALVEATAENRAVMARQAEAWNPAGLLRAIRAFTTAANDAKGGWQPQLPLELAVVECTSPMPVEAAPLPLVEPRPTASEAAPVSRPAPAAPRPVDAVREAPSPASPRAPAAPPAAGPEGAADDLHLAWLRALDLLLTRRKIQKLTKADLEQCSIEGLEGQTLVVSANASFLERLKSRPEFTSTLGAALSEVLGAPHVVKFQPASTRVGRPADARADIPAEGIVATALRDLGGEIIE